MPDLINDSIATKRKSRLGRGLGSLLGEAVVEQNPYQEDISPFEAPVISPSTSADSFQGDILNIPIQKIVPNSSQPRKDFNDDLILELAQSILEKGIIQPLIVRKILTKQPENKDVSTLSLEKSIFDEEKVEVNSYQYEIIAGERRWRAAQLAQLDTIPVIVRETNEQETLEIALIENIQRENLNPIEEAEAYFILFDKHQLTQKEIAEKVGKDRATVANALRLLQLPKEIIDKVRQNYLSVGHAKVLLGLSDDQKIIEIAEKIINHQLSVRATEDLIKKMLSPVEILDEPQKNEVVFEHLKLIQDDIQKLLATKVKIIQKSASKGQIQITYYSKEDLTRLIEVFQKGV